MTRVWALAAIAILLVLFEPLPARAQANGEPSSDLQCFPWQEMKGGRCVAKPATTQPPAAAVSPAPADATDQCGLRSLSTQCKCAAATHLDAASGTCVADAPAAPVTPAAASPAPALPAAPVAPSPVAPRPAVPSLVAPSLAAPSPAIAIVCTGGILTNGACVCPSGFTLMSTDNSPANGGTCVKEHGDNCLGGELTVSGTCLCTGQVVMSGETYGLEYMNGKCLPKRCPKQTVLKAGKCLAISTTAAAPEPEATKPAAPKQADEEDEHRRRCAKGMVRTHSGCVPARHRYPPGLGAIPSDLQRYYRNYQITPGN